MVNRVMISGVICTPVKLRHGEQTSCMSFSIETREGHKSEETKQRNRVLLFGEWANRAHDLKQGDRVYLEGKMQRACKEERGGRKIYWTDLVIDDPWRDKIERMG